MDLKSGNISPNNEDGSSLVAVLIIITIISFLIGSIMMGLVIQNRFIQRDIDKLQARYTAEAGIFHFLGDSTIPILPESDSLKVGLFDSTEEAKIQVKPFGGFLAVTSVAKVGKKPISIRTLVGDQAPALFEKAIVLGDIRSTLNVTGNTVIRGDVAVGPLGVRKRAFKGELFEGSIEGNIKKSTKTLLPEFDKALFNKEIAYCNSLLKSPPKEAIRLKSGKVDLSRIDETKAGGYFFVDGDLEVISSNKLDLPEDFTIIVTGNLALKGAVSYKPFNRFIAGKKLEISNDFTGKNGLFFAGKELEIKGKGAFSGQFITNRKAIISGSTYLKYPSLVYLNGAVEKGIREGRLELSGDSIVEGTLLIPAPDRGINEDKSRLVIGKGSTVRGAVFNTGKTELHGKVLGSVLTLQFYFYHSPTAYINWLKDIDINVEKRPENYVVPLGFSKDRKFEILEWQER